MNPEEPKVAFTMEMTPEDYVEIKKLASWEGKTVRVYLVDCALGRNRRGC